ncbi:MAG: GTP 3',8-cyclase MoaA [Lachnospiraceae bacterium]
MTDEFGRSLNYLRISVTDLCNLRCQYCMPEEGVPKYQHQDRLHFDELEKIVGTLVGMGIDKIRITGGEPLVKRGIVSVIRSIKAMPGVKEVAMTTNGILLEQMASELRSAGLDRVNVSLDTLDETKFREMTRGGDLKQVLSGIKKVQSLGMTPVKLNVVLIGGFNESEISDFVNLTVQEEIEVRFIELMPIGEAVKWNREQFISAEEVLRREPKLQKIKKEDPSSPADYYQLPGAKGKVGIIRPISCKFCSHCNRLRLTSDGKLKYCLHSDNELDLRAVLSRSKDLEKAVTEYIKQKPEEHHLEQNKYLKKSMYEIGG